MTTNALYPTNETTDRETSLKLIDEISQSHFLLESHTFSNKLRVAKAMNELHRLIDEGIMREIMLLAGTPLGFLTDKEYPPQIVKRCVIEAVIRGFSIVGNEFNIISDRFYATKAGLERVVSELPGLSDLRIEMGVPAMKEGGALVPCAAFYSLNGQQQQVDCRSTEPTDMRIPVRVNKGMGADAIIGKATRKLLARVHQRATGSKVSMIEAEDMTPDEMTVDGKVSK